MPHNHLLASHPQRARKCERSHHRQELRGKTDSQSHGEENRVESVLVERNTYGQDEQDQEKGRAQDEVTELPQPSFEFGFRRTRRQPRDNLAELSARPGGSDLSCCRSTG